MASAAERPAVHVGFRTPPSPLGDAEASPLRDADASPVGDADSPPLGDAHSSPLGDAPSSPLGDAPSSPLGDAHSSPLGDAHSSPLGDAETIAAAIARLTTRVADAAVWAAGERRDLLARVDRAVDALAAVRASLLVAERDSGAWQGGGDRSFVAWRSRTTRSGERAATAQVRQAEHLVAVPAVAAAVAQGQVSLDHAATIGRVAATGSRVQQAAVADPATQARLLRVAEDQDAATFATTVARWAASLDGDALERDHQAQRRARFLHLTPTPRGTLIKGQVDTMTGHRIALALEAAVARPAADDDRDPGQRRADALDAMARRILSDSDTKPGAHVPPHVSLMLTEQTWYAARHERRRRLAASGVGAQGGNDARGVELASGDSSSAGADAEPTRSTGASPDAARSVLAGGDAAADADPTRSTGASPDAARNVPASGDAAAGASAQAGDGVVGPHEPATLEDGTPVPPSELAAALCDCDLTRIVIDAAGAPVDLGRTQRLFSGPQRRAVIARDRECAWPACAAPARWCEIHHAQWWERDHGRTAVDLGVLLCAFHHHEVHRRDLTITRIADGPARRSRGTASSTARQSPPLPTIPHPPGPAPTVWPTGAPPSAEAPSAGSPSAEPPTGAPPSAEPPTAAPPSAVPPTAAPPSAEPSTGASLSAEPSAARAAGASPTTLARVRYEFRDRDGRLVGEPPRRAAVARAQSSSVFGPPDVRRAPAAPDRRSAGGASTTARTPRGPEPPGVPRLPAPPESAASWGGGRGGSGGPGGERRTAVRAPASGAREPGPDGLPLEWLTGQVTAGVRSP